MDVSDVFTHLGVAAIVALPLVYVIMKERNRSVSTRTELPLLRTESEKLNEKSTRLEGELKASEEVKSNLKAEISRLTTTVEKERKGFDDLRAELEKSNEKSARLEGELKASEEVKSNLKAEISRLTTTVEKERKGFDDLRAELEKSNEKSARLEGELKASEEVKGNLNIEISRLTTTVEKERKGFDDLRAELEKSNEKSARLEKELKTLDEARGKLNADISRLNTTIEQERKGFAEKTAILDEAKKILGHEFENLGTKIFENTTKKFAEKNKTDMENMLVPLRERITEFDKKVTDTHTQATVQRKSLEDHIKNLKDLGEKMSREAINLTTALKRESQTQGAWGEMVLERALEMSGLRSGVEYLSQPSYKGEDGLLRPDAVVRLPEGKDIVIDSKVSLTAYERYVSCEDPEQKKHFLEQHLTSLRSHVRELGSKSYEDIPEIRTLNYVLMFVPLESAFMLAIEKERELYREAFEKNVIMVCPSTLLATLRTIQSIWQFERQNANAREIAESAGKMYDTFVTFTEHLRKIGERISQSQDAYEKAMSRLCEGRGNLVKRASDLKKLGVKAGKDIPPEIEERSKTAAEVVEALGDGSEEVFSAPALEKEDGIV